MLHENSCLQEAKKRNNEKISVKSIANKTGKDISSVLYSGSVQFLASALEIYSEKGFLYFSLKKFLIFFHKETVLTFS